MYPAFVGAGTVIFWLNVAVVGVLAPNVPPSNEYSMLYVFIVHVAVNLTVPDSFRFLKYVFDVAVPSHAAKLFSVLPVWALLPNA